MKLFFAWFFRKFELREARLSRSRIFPAHRRCLQRSRGRSSLSGFDFICIRNRPIFCALGAAGNLRRHTASLSPRGPAALLARLAALFLRGAGRRALSLALAALLEQPAPLRSGLYAGRCVRTAGKRSTLQTGAPANQQTTRLGLSAATRLMRGFRQNTRMYAPEEDDPLC